MKRAAAGLALALGAAWAAAAWADAGRDPVARAGAAGGAPAADARYADLDRAVDEAVARYRLPGLALGIVEAGEIAHVVTRGERVAGEGAPITRATLFKIASNSKAMTAAALARLVDAGKLAWTDPVTEHLPQFAMHDAWVTREMQVRDLLIHDSGLRAGAGDLMLWPEPNAHTRADVIHGLRYLKPAGSFRSRYDYDNLMYIVAGEVAAAAGGASYETLVAREVFAPLAMRRCRVGEWSLAEAGDVAQPHRRDGSRNIPVREDGAVVRTSTMAAAGGIRCSVDDLLAWVQAWLDPSRAPGWLSEAQRRALWTPQMPMPVSDRMRAWDRTHFSAYGYGWRLADVDGTFKVSHTGTLMGMYSVVTMLPGRDVGFVLLMNGEADEARTVLNQILVKRWSAPAEKPTVAALAALLATERAGVPAAARAPDVSQRAPASAASLQGRLGVYRDPWFGEVSICADETRVEAAAGVRFRAHKSPLLDGTVMRTERADLEPGRLLVDWRDDSVDAEAWLRFGREAGAPATLTMAKVDPDADFSYDFEDLAFERVADCGPAGARSALDGAPDARVPAPLAAAAPDLIDVATLAPEARFDIRYATTDNFVGTPIDGYEAAKCLLLRPAAVALARVARSVRADGHALLIHDCYRPQRAVAHFMRWARDPDDQRTKAAYYPALDKSALVPDYVSPSSGHSRGATVDLTLARCSDVGDGRRFDFCEPLDMGTPYDFFDPAAHTDAPRVGAAQRANRDKLRRAMQAAGFENYPLEWWHYTLKPEPTPEAAHDVPVR